MLPFRTFLALALLGMAGVVRADTQPADAKSPVAKAKTVRLLTVGNSFSQNATRYLRDLTTAAGNVLIHHQAAIGGATMAQHWEKVEQHEKDPQDKRGFYGSQRSLEQELLAEPWDFVTIQQASIRSHDVASYRPYARQLYEFIKKHAPKAEVLVHQTWAYRRDDPRFGHKTPPPGEPATQEDMYQGLTRAYQTIAAELGTRIIPVGDAFHLADADPKWGYQPDTKFDFKNARHPALPDQSHSLHMGWHWAKQADGNYMLNMDGHHANDAGQYLGACVFYEVLFGESVVGNAFIPKGLDPAYARFLQETAHRAVKEAQVKKSSKQEGSATDPALLAPTINTTPGQEYADNARSFQGIPGIERAANGRLWAVWYAGGPKEPGEGPGNYVVLVTSGDDGKTWSTPSLVIDPPGPVRAYDPCLWHDPTGRLWLFWAQSYHWWDGRAGVWAIVTENAADERPRWSAPRRLCHGIMMNKPTVLRTGEWLLPAAVWAGKASGGGEHPYRHDLGSERGANVHVSKDRGATWSFLGQGIVPQRVFDEHSVIERRDGSLWMLVRAAYGIGESVSSDHGKTWSEGRRSDIPHVNSRFHIRRLQSGKLLLVTHQPPDRKTRSHLLARLSDDDGKTWQGGLMIDERAGVSYPDGVQAPDGTIYLIYDFERTGAKQVLLATFTEQDVAQGAWWSAVARQRVVVNQATGKRAKQP